MYICLLPTEILLHIFTNNHSKNLNHRSHVTLAALARTCRKFQEPALDILWKDINGFKPLISCLPESIAHTNAQGYLTLKRPLYYGEWELIDRYTRRIDSFTVVSIELDKIDIRVAQALMSAPSPTPLLPNLRILRWFDRHEHLYPLLRNFLASTITTMQLSFRSTPPLFAQSALLASLGARCPSIQELTCASAGDSEDAFCEALGALQELFCLETGVLNPRVLLRLTSLPSLKYLQFGLETYNINEMQLDSPTIFSRLERVHITAQSQSVINNCLRNVRFPSCRSGKVYVRDDDDLEPHYPLNIPDLIISLSECFSPALQKLHFVLGFDFNALKEDTLANPSSALSFNAITPLLSFSRLTDLRLD
ncbi:hypothetical protein DEU56DRAFT_732937 [Suillus clintonianus]|uniref:uncharacterized protein n=1 Tax=Suillus clintonianus TaxID=1904413 RepID=UPI001B8750C0|nr:uncharacterized protein DEU56DRAFT_732937 [Suillus clintonianus]KAG2144267.1 hypothetical protein DEU56DRAFT_732937 [Suillus clintonianus]